MVNLTITKKLLMLSISVASLAIGGMSSKSAQAAPFKRDTGLTNPDQTLIFDEIVLARHAIVTDQYSGLGIEFSPGLIYNIQENLRDSFYNVGGNRIGNFPRAVLNYNAINPFSIKFLEEQREVAFAMIANPGISSFTALLNGSVVETFSTFTISVSPDNFYGFTDIVFDEVQIKVGGLGEPMLLDNLQTIKASEKSVSELTNILGIFAIGIFGIGWRLKLQRDVVLTGHLE